jgi:DNA-binding response OmpR family regulator
VRSGDFAVELRKSYGSAFGEDFSLCIINVTSGMSAKRILIVDDDIDLRRLFRMTLTVAGYEVQQAGDGVEALQLIDNSPPDLVVLDLMLRALDGISVQQELAARAVTRHIPIVIITGSSLELAGVNVACVLRKPVMPDELIKTVAACLASGAPTEIA